VTEQHQIDFPYKLTIQTFPEVGGLYDRPGVPEPDPEEKVFSLVMEREIDLPYPRKPLRRRGLWAFLTRANAKAEAKWQEEEAAWQRANGKGRQRIYMPRVTVNGWTKGV